VDQEEIWLRLLAFAAGQLAWAGVAAGPTTFADCLQEAGRHEHLHLRCPDVFDRLEFLERAAAGWHEVRREGKVPGDFLDLLACFWTRPFADLRRAVTALLGDVAVAPDIWLDYLDQINDVSPQLVALFGQMLDSYGWTINPEHDPRDPKRLGVLARRFLAEHGQKGYAPLREPLLDFCLRELIAPDVVAQQAASGAVVLPEARLNLLVNDWPLRHVYRACALFWS
jgi:hypothetical protein